MRTINGVLVIQHVNVFIHDHDPPQTKTLLGEPLGSVRLTGDSVSEVLQMFLEAHGEQPELALRLRTTPFRALHPAHKATLLAALVNELCCSKAVVRWAHPRTHARTHSGTHTLIHPHTYSLTDVVLRRHRAPVRSGSG